MVVVAEATMKRKQGRQVWRSTGHWRNGMARAARWDSSVADSAYLGFQSAWFAMSMEHRAVRGTAWLKKSRWNPR
jgi:hypothetical protein